MIRFTLAGEFIELAKLLKATGLCGTGGEAKQAVLAQEVRVDGEVETRRGRKIRAGQKVSFGPETIEITAPGPGLPETVQRFPAC